MTKSKIPEWAKCIIKLRKYKGMSQDSLAEAIGVKQGRVSEWESGKTNPSVEAWIKLGALAAKSDPPLAILFWKQTGLDPELITSLAGALLESGEAQAGSRLLAVTESIIKRRTGESEVLRKEGKTILVPPFTEGIWREWQTGFPPVSVDARWVKNEGSTFYLRTEKLDRQQENKPKRNPVVGRGFVPGDVIIFDSSEAPASRVAARFLDRPVLINVTDAGFNKSLSQPEGLYIGLLRENSEMLYPSLLSITLQPYGAPRGSKPLLCISSLPIDEQNRVNSQELGRGRLEEIAKQMASISGGHVNEQAVIVGMQLLMRRNRAIRSALSGLRMPDGCEIMGNFVGLLSSYAEVRRRSEDDIATSDDFREQWLKSVEDTEE